ncbi:MAG TPA: SDR family oxidoreductase [Candidatus Stackebrandtia faecavium]|nr:SDR family oxidoreductase [Candidatus Stackebrandtia faecavium]
MNTALITGATSGIGAAFARHLGQQGHDLLLVARNKARLEESATDLRARFGVDVSTIAADLTDRDDCETVEKAAADVDLLVNNAGLGLGKGFTDNDVADEEYLLNLNIRAVMRLTHAALTPMRQRGHGGIINVSSVAGFAPVMPGSTYNASKAWVTNFSESMAPLARSGGVNLMALCPGFVRTEFHDRAAIEMADMPRWMLLDADFVVESAMRDFLRGRVVSVPSVLYKAISRVIHHVPNGLLSSISERAEVISRRGKTEDQR